MNQAGLLILTLSLASILLGGEPIYQSKSATEAPTLDQILDKYVQALGGRVALEGVNSRASAKIVHCGDIRRRQHHW
jgi:hypothetical protein